MKSLVSASLIKLMVFEEPNNQVCTWPNRLCRKSLATWLHIQSNFLFSQLYTGQNNYGSPDFNT